MPIAFKRCLCKSRPALWSETRLSFVMSYRNDGLSKDIVWHNINTFLLFSYIKMCVCCSTKIVETKFRSIRFFYWILNIFNAYFSNLLHLNWNIFFINLSKTFWNRFKLSNINYKSKYCQQDGQLQRDHENLIHTTKDVTTSNRNKVFIHFIIF